MFTNEKCNYPCMKMNWNFPVVIFQNETFKHLSAAEDKLETNGCKNYYKYLVG